MASQTFSREVCVTFRGGGCLLCKTRNKIPNPELLIIISPFKVSESFPCFFFSLLAASQ